MDVFFLTDPQDCHCQFIESFFYAIIKDLCSILFVCYQIIPKVSIYSVFYVFCE